MNSVIQAFNEVQAFHGKWIVENFDEIGHYHPDEMWKLLPVQFAGWDLVSKHADELEVNSEELKEYYESTILVKDEKEMVEWCKTTGQIYQPWQEDRGGHSIRYWMTSEDNFNYCVLPGWRLHVVGETDFNKLISPSKIFG